MAYLSLDQAENSENQRPKKSGTPETSASLTLATTAGDVLWTADDASSSAILHVMNSPTIGGVIKWTHATGATLSLTVWLSNDPAFVIATRTPYIPAVAGSGTTPAYPQVVTFAKASWVVGAATVTYVPITVHLLGHRFAKIQLADDNASGTAIVYLGGGTN